MDKKTLNKLIKNPKELNEKQLAELDKILEENPYFATARLMKIKDLIHKKDPQVLNEIQSSTLYLHDKNVFFDDLIRIENSIVKNAVSDSEKENDISGLPENLVSKDFTNEILDEITVIGKGVKETVIESFEQETPKSPVSAKTEKKEEKKEENKVEEKKAEPITQKQDIPAKDKSPDPLKAELKKESSSASQDKKEPKTEKFHSKSEESDGTSETSKHSVADDVIASLAELRKQKEEREKVLAKAMSHSKEGKATAEKTDKKDKKTKPEESKPEKKKQEEKEVKKSPEKSAPKNKKVKKDQKIIEKFIKSEPRLKPPDKIEKEEHKEDLSKASTELPSNLVSENLANIFEKQGKITKAIAIYKQLILKYPEKKSYFAQKIENLEK